jgi:hypothetical protein
MSQPLNVLHISHAGKLHFGAENGRAPALINTHLRADQMIPSVIA